MFTEEERERVYRGERKFREEERKRESSQRGGGRLPEKVAIRDVIAGKSWPKNETHRKFQPRD